MPIPSQTQILPVSPEALQLKSKAGKPGFVPGLYYSQYAASDAVTTVAGSLFKPSAGSLGSLTFPAGFFNAGNGYSILGLAPNVAQAGTKIRVRICGTLVSSGTGTITLLAKLTNGAGTAQTLATTGTPALVSITNGTTANTSPFCLDLEMMVTSYAVGAATGSIVTRGEFKYSSAPLTGVAPLSIMIPGGTPETTVSSYDLSQSLTLDVTAVISATGTITATSATIEVLN